MAATLLRLPGRARAARCRRAIGGAAALIGAIVALWPTLLASPVLGGPLVALSFGLAGWSLARAAAPLPHANDNTPCPVSPARARHAMPAAQRSGATAMFGSSKTEPRRAGGLSVIGADVTVTGNIATEGDIHVDGTVEGDIACGSLVQGASGRVVGIVTAKTARIAGTIEGRVSAGTLTVEKTAKLRGDADYQTVQIENGAQVDGRMTHRTGEPRATAEGPLRLVDASDAAG